MCHSTQPETETSLKEKSDQTNQNNSRETDDKDPVIRQHNLRSQFKTATENLGQLDSREIAKNRTRELHENKTNTPCSQQTFKRPIVKVANNQRLDEQPHTTSREKCNGQRQRKKQIDIGNGQDNQANILNDKRKISPDHHKLTMRHIDNTDLPVDNRQTKRNQNQNRPQTETDKSGLNHHHNLVKSLEPLNRIAYLALNRGI